MVIGETGGNEVLSDEVNRTIIVRGLGGTVPAELIFAPDQIDHPSEMVEISDQTVLFQIFSQFGEFVNATVRKRVAKAWERDRLDREGILYNEVQDGLGTTRFSCGVAPVPV